MFAWRTNCIATMVFDEEPLRTKESALKCIEGEVGRACNGKRLLGAAVEIREGLATARRSQYKTGSSS